MGYANWVYLFFILTVILAYTVASDHISAQRHAYYFFSYCVIIYIIIKSLADEKKIRMFVAWIGVFAASLSIRAMSDGKFVKDRLEKFGPSDANSSNEFAVVLAATIPLLLPFILKGNKFEKIFGIISIIILLHTFILCASRGAFVSLVFACLYTYFFLASAKMKKVLLIMAFMFAPIFLVMSNADFRSRMATIWEYEEKSEVSLNELSSGRVETWIAGLNMIKDHPMGVGPDGFRALSRFYINEASLTQNNKYDYPVKAAHNSYLQVAVEQGLFGLFVYCIICFGSLYAMFKKAHHLRKIDDNSFFGAMVVAVNMSLFAVIAGGMFGAQVYFEFFWWVIALSVVAISFDKANNVQHHTE
ncbi:MAG: O-antigen ligase family protein [Thermodesulfobacteriota bacterium]